MQQEKDTGTEHPPFRPSGGGILALLDAPEGDAGVLAEARFYGEEGCEELLAAVGPGSNLDLERKARGVHLLGLLGCKKLIGLSQDLLKEGLFPVEVSLAYALARIEMKAEGKLRHVGITTSHGRRHDLLERIMQEQPIDFVQLTYNVLDRTPEDRLLPLAQERGVAVIVNRPYQRGALIERYRGAQLPGWAVEIGAETWPQVLLKFIISHPAVTVAIPATRQIAHLRENKAASRGLLPDAKLRRRMAWDLAQI